ncbi:MAG: hypothetical protein LKE86_08755 [Eubacterium sp.]|nr:hypothetical protein [Eubacterium sp.]
MSECPNEEEILNQIEKNSKLDKNVKIWNSIVSSRIEKIAITDLDIYEVCITYCETCELSTIQQVYYARLKYTRNCTYNFFRAAVINTVAAYDVNDYLWLMTLSGNPLHPGEDRVDAVMLTAAKFAVKEESAKRKLSVFCDVLDVAINNNIVVKSDLDKIRRKSKQKRKK